MQACMRCPAKKILTFEQLWTISRVWIFLEDHKLFVLHRQQLPSYFTTRAHVERLASNDEQTIFTNLGGVQVMVLIALHVVCMWMVRIVSPAPTWMEILPPIWFFRASFFALPLVLACCVLFWWFFRLTLANTFPMSVTFFIFHSFIPEACFFFNFM